MRFQADFVAALDDEGASFPPARHASFAVYRNTAMRACLDALEGNFPAIVCLVGRDWFRAAAAIHIIGSPPSDARLFTYGEDFPAFLADFEPAAALPYLADVARLDRLWTESANAPDDDVLHASALVGCGPEALAASRLRVHPATRMLASSHPVVSIWEASRRGAVVDAAMVWRPEYALVTRADLTVQVCEIDAEGRDLLGGIGGGATLGAAASQTLGVHPRARIDLTLAGLLTAGAFAA
jgi:hypothetical protein